MNGTHDLGRGGRVGDLVVGTGLGNSRPKPTDREIADSVPQISHTSVQVSDVLSDTARARCEG